MKCVPIGQLVKGGTADTAIGTDDDFHSRILIPYTADYSLSDGHIPFVGMTVSGPQYRNDDLSGVPVVEEKLIVHKPSVKTVEHGQLLGTVGRVIRGIDINDYLFPSFQRGHIPVYPGITKIKYHGFISPVLKSGKSGLRGHFSLQNIFEQRIFLQMMYIVGVLIALYLHENPLFEHFLDGVANFGGIPVLGNELAEVSDDFIFSLKFLQEHDRTVRADLPS